MGKILTFLPLVYKQEDSLLTQIKYQYGRNYANLVLKMIDIDRTTLKFEVLRCLLFHTTKKLTVRPGKVEAKSF